MGGLQVNRREFSKLSTLGAAAILQGATPPLGRKTLVSAQEGGHTNASRDAWFKEARFGMFLTFGLSTLLGEEVLAQSMDGIAVEEYAKLKDRYNPTEFSAREWVQLVKEAGQRYMLLTTKNHDGFALWDTKLSDFSVMHSPFGRDICKELAEECHRQNMPLFFYFSLMDWHSPLYRGSLANGTPVSREFVEFMHGQVRELCTNYGPVSCMWFDGDWNHTPGQWEAEKLVRMIRELQPQALINNRLGRYNPDHIPAWEEDHLGDFSCPEMSLRGLPNESGRAWEFNSTINDNWAWAKTDTRYKSTARLIHLLVNSVALGGNYLLNASPLPTGKIDPRQAERLRDMGKWLSRNGESIYGAAAFRPIYYDSAFSTRKGDQVYLHILDWPPGASIDFWTLELKDAKRAYFLETGAGAEFTCSKNDFGLRLRIRNTNPEPSPDTVIVFDGAVPLKER